MRRRWIYVGQPGGPPFENGFENAVRSINAIVGADAAEIRALKDRTLAGIAWQERARPPKKREWVLALLCLAWSRRWL